MQKIMDMSIKNKKLLELEPISDSNDNEMFMENSLKKIDSRNKLKNIKANRQYLNQNSELSDILNYQEEKSLEVTQKICTFQEIHDKTNEKIGSVDKKK